MANSQASQKINHSFKQKIGKIGHWIKVNLKMIVVLVLVLGLGVGIGWWARTSDLKNVQAYLDNAISEKNDIKSELEYYTSNKGGCYNTYDGTYKPCPTMSVLEARRVNDSMLPSGSYFVLVDVEFQGPENSSTTISSSLIKLKDEKSYIYPQQTQAVFYDSKSEITTYESIVAIPLLTEQGDIALAAGEKVRGTLVFKVGRASSTFTISLDSSKSEPFSL